MPRFFNPRTMAAYIRYLSSMSPAAGHSFSRTGLISTTSTFDTRSWTSDQIIRITSGNSDYFREISTGSNVATRYTIADTRGYARANLEVITKRRPHWPAARPSCYSYHSSLLSSPSFIPCLFRAFTLSPSVSLEIPTDTDGHRRIYGIIDIISPFLWISVTKLPHLPIFTLINKGMGKLILKVLVTRFLFVR